MKRLKNGKACGPDKVPGGLLKYGTSQLSIVAADIINQSVAEGAGMSSFIGLGTLIPLQKPKKPRGSVTSLRPIVLLNTIRKGFSLVVLCRIAKDVARYVGPTQSGFRQGRSTTDVVWTQRWIAAKATRYNWECHMLGIDMSRAFDMIDRTKLLDVMALVTGPDEVRMIQHLLFHTQISVKVGKATANPFLSTPQGDGLSPVLFICFLEAALSQVRENLPERHFADRHIPGETGYADDVTLYSTSEEWLK